MLQLIRIRDSETEEDDGGTHSPDGGPSDPTSADLLADFQQPPDLSADCWIGLKRMLQRGICTQDSNYSLQQARRHLR